ncbi:mlr9360 (plasmid) [Mesorhizobium japonicum MAFF 303099]|uniref:Mlr9360 protein n=2 Tax=Mesorhizobium japonicum TaxID=2066070 RepID=Q981I5_RHILO|nr:mlr9360 [Mesorhizobium japonicum MAFF 303099]
MILRPKPSPRHHATLAGAPSTAPMTTVPAWLRRAVPDAQGLASKNAEDVALVVGAAIGALDAVVRRQERWSGAWRQRLALSAAAATAKQAGRVEDESALRDAVLLTRPGDFLSVGPAGSMLLAWRRLASTPAEKLLTEASIGAVLDDLGLRRDDDAVSDLADDLRQLPGGIGMVGMLTGAFTAAERYGFARAFGCWLADALLAHRLGWAHAVPLLGAEAGLGTSARPRRSAASSLATGIETDPERAKSLLAAQARAALRAIDLSAELERRAGRLLAVAPKLRAKAADAVVDKLLSDDAIVASEKIAGMSDRGLRRLFDRLVELGAVRELSGRPAFRIYGL